MGVTGEDQTGQRLHDRATRGHTLTRDEDAQLDAWYASQDAAEAATLRIESAPADLHDLQAAVEHTISRIVATSGQVQELEAQNSSLRAEIADLQQRLRRRRSTPAP